MANKSQGSGHKISLATAIAVARMRREQAAYTSVQAFVRKLGISEGTYNLLVSGATNPTIGTLEKIAAGMGLTFFELIGNIDEATLRKRVRMANVDYDAAVSTLAAYDAAMAGFDSIVGGDMTPGKSAAKRGPSAAKRKSNARSRTPTR